MKRKKAFYISTYNLVIGSFDDIKCLYRYDPVPSTGKKWRFTGDIMKRPKTTQEKRYSFSCPRKYIRGKRSFCNLPDPWDDYVRSDLQNKRGWKKKKIKKQWMKHS